MDTSPLGRLPAELRNAIYELALCSTEEICIDARSDMPVIESPPREQHATALTTVCREVRVECLGVFFGCNQFRVVLPASSSPQFAEWKGLWYWLAQIERQLGLLSAVIIDDTADRSRYSSVKWLGDNAPCIMARYGHYAKASELLLPNKILVKFRFRVANNTSQSEIVTYALDATGSFREALAADCHSQRMEFRASLQAGQTCVSKYATMHARLKGRKAVLNSVIAHMGHFTSTGCVKAHTDWPIAQSRFRKRAAEPSESDGRDLPTLATAVCRKWPDYGFPEVQAGLEGLSSDVYMWGTPEGRWINADKVKTKEGGFEGKPELL